MEKLNAGKIFRAAMGESNLQRKRDLLLRAKSILSSLIDKYSTSPSIDMVIRNISVVDEELMKLPSADE